MTQPATNLSLSQEIQAAIKRYVEADVAQSGNHCLRCALARAHAHIETVQETTASILDLAAHSHRVGKGSRAAQDGQE